MEKLYLENFNDWKTVEDQLLHIRVNKVEEVKDRPNSFSVDFEVIESQTFFTKVFYREDD